MLRTMATDFYTCMSLNNVKMLLLKTPCKVKTINYIYCNFYDVCLITCYLYSNAIHLLVLTCIWNELIVVDCVMLPIGD